MKPTSTSSESPTRKLPDGMIGFLGFVLLVSAVQYRLLFDWVRLALGVELHSYVLLIPFVTGYLIHLQRATIPARQQGSPGLAAIPALAGALALAAYWNIPAVAAKGVSVDRIAAGMFSYFCFLLAGGFFFFGRRVLGAVAFPVAFLVFIVPLPSLIIHGLEVFFQHTSADASFLLIKASGTPVLRDGLFLQLPGITLQVAEECSGIRSSLMLFITSLLTGYLFLRRPGLRIALVLSVIVIGIIRNGFRIFTISMLCVHLDPKWIDSAVHHKGGPIFFALSLIPFFGFLLLLRKWDRKKPAVPPTALPAS